MTKKALNPGPHGVEHIGILPTGVMYIDREIDSGDGGRLYSHDYLTALDVARLKAALSVSDAGLLGVFARRFSCGRDIVEWLHAAGIPTSHRGDDWTPGRPEVIDAATRAKLEALSAERSAPSS